MIVLDIDDAPPSLNLVLRMNWQRKHALTHKWRKWVWAARCQVIRGRPTPLTKARVTIERVSPKLLDKDNLYGSVKVVVDALRCNELIFNDDPESLALEVTQRKGRSHLRIQIEDAVLTFQTNGSRLTPTSQTCSSAPSGAVSSSAVDR